jgi:hypothetical protein
MMTAATSSPSGKPGELQSAAHHHIMPTRYDSPERSRRADGGSPARRTTTHSYARSSLPLAVGSTVENPSDAPCSSTASASASSGVLEKWGSNGFQDQDDVVIAPISTVEDTMVGKAESYYFIAVHAVSRQQTETAQAAVGVFFGFYRPTARPASPRSKRCATSSDVA